MHTFRSSLVALFLVLFASAALAQPAAPEPRWNILFIATGNVPAGKFVHLKEIAAAHGIRVQHRYLHELPAAPDAGLWSGFDAVFVDSYLQDQVRARLAQALPDLHAPHAWLWDARAAWRGFPDPLGQRLVDYYSSGAEQNFRRFFASLRLHFEGGDPLTVAAPVIFPKSALYHPKAPDLVFASVAEYLAWRGVDSTATQRPPLLAVAFHQQYLASMETGLVDDLIAGIEQRGGVALAFYAPAMRGPGWQALLAPDGTAVFDVMLNTQITLDGEARRNDFEALDRPVIQLLNYRKGTPKEWAEDPLGLSLTDIPFYLAQPEYAGAIDAQVVAATEQPEERLVTLPAQLDSVLDKAFNLVRLQRTARADQRLALMFWNYPPGEKNLSASFLNLPESLERVLASLHEAGYALGELPTQEALLAQLQATLAPFYRDVALADMIAANAAATLPMRAYRQWYGTLPETVRSDIESRWGQPEQSLLVLDREGEAHFVIPRVELGQLVLLPQPARGERWEPAEKALYHSSTAAPSHHYLATYLWLRQAWRSDALIHFGTHGSQEWLPGKERGLSVHDYPMLALGAVPVVYPYIVDNIGEALQARRRGRASVVSHQTPPFRPAGLHQTLVDLHDRLHAWMNQDQGALREQLRRELIDASAAANVLADLGWDAARAEADFPAYAEALHTHLHELAQTAQPLGLHAFGRAPQDQHRLGSVLLMLGRDFWEAAAAHAGAPADQLDEALAGDYAALQDSAPYRLLQRHLIEAADPAALPEALQAQLARARAAYALIGASAELPALLDGLRGDYLPTSYGGDPIRSPDAYPTGRNLYGFDPSRVPTRSAWTAAERAATDLFEAHRQRLGSAPQKLTFSLWSVETMRHQGLLEAQALWLLGVRPVWDEGGRVTGVELIPRKELGRPRVDVVLSATGLYRDHFPNLLQHLARAVELAAAAAEADNPVAAHSRAIEARLSASGLDAQAARLAALTRIFSSASGSYGTGLDDATLASDSWEGKTAGDAKLAELYLAKMQHAYGPRIEDWGRADLAGAGVNLYAEHLRGTQGAVLSRSSNLYGMLTTDDPFQYLGGIALAVRHLDGAAPELSISNLRSGGSGRLESAAGFLAKELATRQFHPGYIEGLMAEGYAGTLEVTAAMNNFWGWTAVAREIVRDDQWQSFVDVYVRDRHALGLREWFERENPAALAQVIERMLEASRQGYWQADAATVDELKQRYADLLQRFDLQTSNAALAEFVGYGLRAAAIPAQPVALTPLEQVEGQRLQRVDSAAPALDLVQALAPLLITVLLGLGAWRQARSSRPAPGLAAALGHARGRDTRHHGRQRRSRAESTPHANATGAHHD
jgi:cobaltochelatase CobN